MNNENSNGGEQVGIPQASLMTQVSQGIVKKAIMATINSDTRTNC